MDMDMGRGEDLRKQPEKYVQKDEKGGYDVEKVVSTASECHRTLTKGERSPLQRNLYITSEARKTPPPLRIWAAELESGKCEGEQQSKHSHTAHCTHYVDPISTWQMAFSFHDPADERYPMPTPSCSPPPSPPHVRQAGQKSPS